jgi:hypothetical protein
VRNMLASHDNCIGGAGSRPDIGERCQTVSFPAEHHRTWQILVPWPGSTAFTLPFPYSVTLWSCACPSVVEVRFQEP